MAAAAAAADSCTATATAAAQQQLVPFPLLADPQAYCAFTFDYYKESSK